MLSPISKSLFSSKWIVFTLALSVSITAGCGSPSDDVEGEPEGNPPVVEPEETDDSNWTGARQSDEQPVNAVADQPINLQISQDAEPDQVVKYFLAAMKNGDKPTVSALLTDKAKTETSKHNLVVQPIGSPSATFQVGKVELVKGGAYVNCLWSEIPPGRTDTRKFEIIWVLKNQESGWRIAGMATRITPESSPTFLNFENPEEMLGRIEQAGNPADAAEVAGN